MIPIDKLTEKVLEERYDSLPNDLQEVLASDANLDAIVKICNDHYLQDGEKILITQQIAALAILGFIHAADMGAEINEALFLNNPKLANEIAENINKKIFAPIKVSLEKNYRPLLSEVAEKSSEKLPLNDVLEKIKNIPTERVLMTGTPPMPPAPGIVPKIAPQPVNLPIITEKESAKPIMSPPKALLVGLPTPTPKPTIPWETTPQPLKIAGSAAPAPKPSAPAPIILHQEVTIAPTTNAPVLRSGNLVSRNLIENTPGSAAPPPPPPVARLEYEHKEGTKPRIVNYSALNTTLPPKPVTPMATPEQRAETPASAATPGISPKPAVSIPVSAPAVLPKDPMPMQNNTLANIPPPATTSTPNLASIPGKPISHTLDLSPKPPIPPPPDVK